jgi:glycosyltransferase involved in cell wall biosynthesis
MNILALISGYDGCGYYRIQLIAKYLNKLPDVYMKISFEYSKELIDWADLIVLQKQVNQKAIPFVEYAKSKGKKIITEVDDDYFNIPEWNPAHKYYLDKQENLINFYKLSDAMTVTNEHLAQEMRKYNSNVYVLPNSLDIPFIEKLKTIPDEEKFKHIKYLNKNQKKLSIQEAFDFLKDKKVIGWGGSPTHLRDLQQATNALIEICKKDKDIVLMMMACSTDDLLNNINSDQIILVNPVPIFLYHKNLILQKWDLGICPIEDNLFNRSKSNLKYLEFSSLGFACVCSDVENYRKTINHLENGILTKNTDDSWYTAFNSILYDDDLKNKIGNNAEFLVKKDYDISKNYIYWYNLYKDILGKD